MLMFPQTVIEIVCYFTLPKFIEDCNQLRRMEQQIQQDAWGSAYTARVTQQCLHWNCLQMI